MSVPGAKELYKTIDEVIATSVNALQSLKTTETIRHQYNEAWSRDDYLKVAALALCLLLLGRGWK